MPPSSARYVQGTRFANANVVTPFSPEDYLLKNRQDAEDAKKKKEQER